MSLHHFNAADSAEDFDCSPNCGSFGDVSVHLGTYRGINSGGPFREEYEPERAQRMRVPGTSVMVIVYFGDRPRIGVAHVAEEGNQGVIEIDVQLGAAIERYKARLARKGPMVAPTRAQKRRAA